ncbi:hypothetical protein XF35_02820 [Streptomyces platensis subsp. clarensis]|nr:hypothetical protein [Streptomyces platensis subsp. clarensis]
MTHPDSPPDAPSHQPLAALERAAPFSVRHIGPDAEEPFRVPHGGGGPGVGPVAVREYLAPYLPSHPMHPDPAQRDGGGPVSAAPYGSTAILPITWAYSRMMGADGLTTDRFCDSMIAIRREIDKVGDAVWPKDGNPLVNAPHMAQMPARDGERPYSRNTAAYPMTTTGRNKYWPPVRRVDGAHGDRNLLCSCPSIDAHES